MERNAFNELIAALKEEAEGYRNLKADPVYEMSKAQMDSKERISQDTAQKLVEAKERIYQDTAQKLDQLAEILELGTENAFNLYVSFIGAYVQGAADEEAMIFDRHPSQIK